MAGALRLGLLLIFAAPAISQELGNYRSRTWQTDDGLPQNSVLSLAQTPDGFLWVGTQEGLARFNGIDFRLVQHAAAPHLAKARITALCAGRDGSLWIGCEDIGVTRYHQGHFTTYTLTNGLPNLEIRCFAEQPDGAVWVGTENGLVLLSDKVLKIHTTHTGLGDNSVRALTFDAKGNLFAATKRGLTTIGVDGQVSTRVFPGRWNANALRAVIANPSGALWVGATDGLYRIDQEEQTTYNVREGLPDRIINAILRDNIGAIWVGTYGGLARITDGRIMSVTGPDSIADHMVNVILEDRERNLWVGTRDGLMRLTPSRFDTYTTASGLTGNNVMSVLEDSSGGVWLGIWGGGVNLLRDGRITVYRHASEMARDSVLSLCESSSGAIWAGMDFELGLNIITNGTRVTLPGLVSNGPIRALYEDPGGTLWVGGEAGLTILGRETTNTYTATNGLSGNVVRVIAPGPDGDIWVGTDRGISRFSSGAAQVCSTVEGFPATAVNALYFDEDGTLWIGTLGSGLYARADDGFKQWTTRDGIFSDDIYEIVEDDYGNLWMSCRSGLFRVPKRRLLYYQDGRLDRVSSTVFGKADGLLSVQFNGVAKPGAWKDRLGRLWFASIRGVVQVDPSIRINDRPPPISIERVLAGQQLLWPPADQDPAAPRKLTIPPGTSDVEIHYAALSLSVPEKNRYSYRLDGADSRWTSAGAQRMARYNKLAPGKYTFRVIACNNDGVWNEEGASLAMTVLPLFWQTWWFRVLAGLALAALAWLAYKVRVSRLRALEALRINIAANLHDDVGARLTKVAMITEHVIHQVPPDHAIKPGIDAIARATADVTLAMDEVVWTINPQNDTLENLANYMFHYAQEYFQNTKIRCLLDFPTHLPERDIPTATRHNLFMAVKETLTNALKHSKASEVRIELRSDENALIIVIADNGAGFDLDRARKTGDGLKNIRQRIEQLGGNVTWLTQPGQGTTVTIHMPWD